MDDSSPVLKRPTARDRVNDLHDHVGYGQAKRDHKLKLKDVAAVLIDRGFDPIEAILDAMDSLDVNMRVKTCLSLAEFVHPKRKAMEHSGEGGGPLVVEVVRFAPDKAS